MYKFLVVILVVFAAISTNAQEIEIDSVITNSETDPILTESSLILELPALDSAVIASHKNSPAIKHYEAQVLKTDAEIKMRKREWTNRVFTDAGTYYINNYNVLTVAGDNGGFESVSLGNGNVARAGITVRVSLFDAVGRPQLVAKAEAEKEMARASLEMAKNQLTARVTQAYTEVKMHKKLIEVGVETIETLEAQLQMAEKEFRQGEIHITELARITEIKSKSEMNLAKAQSNYENAYKQLELLIGCSLQSLI